MADLHPRLHGRTCVVTGGTSGIGLEVAKGLARLGADVVIIGRSAERSRAAMDALRSLGAGQHARDEANLESMDDVRLLARRLLERYAQIDVLVNNAGAVFGARRLSPEGIERTFALNVVSPYLLTTMLQDRLASSGAARVVNISSEAHRTARIHWDDLQGNHRYRALRAYGQSKLALLLLTYYWAGQLRGKGVCVNAVHPGFVRSGFGLNNSRAWRWGMKLAFLFAISSARGSRTPLWVASAPELEGVTGRYFAHHREVQSSERSYSAADGARLVDVLRNFSPTSP